MKHKITIYQILPRLFDNPNEECIPGGTLETNGAGKYGSFTPQALQSISDLGCTHVWYTGILEHATRTSFASDGIPGDHEAIVKGQAGSPYSIKDYYDVTPTLADVPAKRMEEFEDLIRRTHDAGLKVIIDFVPNHVARQYHSDLCPQYTNDFGEFDDRTQAFLPSNNYYYLPMETLVIQTEDQSEPIPYMEFPARATGNDKFTTSPDRNDWYDTVKLNYGIDYLGGHTEHFDPIPDTWEKMRDIIGYWLTKGVDGFRCDMAEMVPVEFWRFLIGYARNLNPEVLFIAEIYKPELYDGYLQAGFDYLYDKVGLYDMLIDILKGQRSAADIRYIWQSQETLKGSMLRFMENHDEQRLASDFVVGDPFRAYPAMVMSALIDAGAVMIYFGQELGERGMDVEGYSGRDGRTSIFDYWSLETMRRWIGRDHTFSGDELEESQRILREKYRKLLNAAISLPALSSGTFFDLMYVNADYPVDTSKEYYFLRAYGSEVALVGINFSDHSIKREVKIPEHAFAMMNVGDEAPCVVTDVFGESKGVGSLSSHMPFTLEIPAYDAVIYYFCAQDQTFPEF